MPTTYGGITCLDPFTTLASCVRRGFAAPWWGRCNGFDNVLGPGPGSGLILLTWNDLASLTTSTGYRLDIASGDTAGGRVVLQNLRVAGTAYAALPTARHANDTAFVVPIADRRMLAATGPVLARDYNLRTPSGTAYVTASQNAGTPWTWATMLGNIWAANTYLDAYPGLPFTPDGAPENFAFDGTPSYAALTAVLDVLGCALELDLIADTFSIVRIAATDAAAEAALARLENTRRVWDAYPAECDWVRLPQFVKVVFPAFHVAPENPASVLTYEVDVAGGDSGALAGNYLILPDTLAARYDGDGALLNSSALASRAAERAGDWYRRARESRLARVYSGAAGDLMPCARLKGVGWRDYGAHGGVFTSVYRHPGYSVGGAFVPLDGARGPGEPAATPWIPPASVSPAPPAPPAAFGPAGTPSTYYVPSFGGGGSGGPPLMFGGGPGAPAGQGPWRFDLAVGGGAGPGLAWAFLLPLFRLGNGPAPPAVVGTPSATPGDTTVSLTWTASAGPPPAAYYVIYVSTSGDMSGAYIAGTSDSAAFTVTGLTNGTLYYFTVAAMGPDGGASAMSGIASATPAGGGPPCSTSETYTATVIGSSGADGTYNFVWSSGQEWIAASGGVTASLDLSASPYTLIFQIGILGPTGTFETTSFSCASGGTFAFDSETGGETWPGSVTVT